MSQPLFTSKFKRKGRLLAAALLFAAGTLPFGVGLVAISYLLASPSGLPAAVVTALALVLGLLLPWVSYGRLALIGNASLRRTLIGQLDIDWPTTEAEFVGFAPGNRVRLWEGETDQDVGFLRITDGALIYHGDSFSWSLRRESVDSIHLVEVPAATRRIVVEWHTPGQPGRSFTLASRQADTLSGANQATKALAEALGGWHSDDSSADRVPALGLPPTSLGGSIPVEQLPAGGCLSVLSVAVIALLSVWYVVQQLVGQRLYYHAALWAGLIVVGAMIFASYFLSYLQAGKARQSQPDLT